MLAYTHNPYQGKAKIPDRQRDFSPAALERVRAVHATFPGYKPTPLVALPALAKSWGVRAIYVKDESFRFGLNSFKAIGASYAVARCLAGRAGLNGTPVTYDLLRSLQRSPHTFATATDGNHGRGLAWAARLLGHNAVVNMPKGTVVSRVEAIRELGARVSVTEFNYDDTVRLTARQAGENGYTVVQDTAWPGYEDIPLDIMRGYGVIALEAAEQLSEAPTHVFLQAGVGSFAGATLAALRNIYDNLPPRAALVEADAAACFHLTAKHASESPMPAPGNSPTIMAGLDCREMNSLAWPLLRNHCEWFFAIDDIAAACGMRILSSPLAGDPRIISGESGAAGLAALAMLCGQDMARVRAKFGLNEQAVLLIFNTEGDTDPENFRRIVWQGEYGLAPSTWTSPQIPPQAGDFIIQR